MIDLEYHHHIIIKVLDHFLTSSKLSINKNRDEILLRENSAKLLAKLAIENDDVRYPNLKPFLFKLLSQKLATLTSASSFTAENYPMIEGILKFFSYMDSVTVKNYLMDL